MPAAAIPHDEATRLHDLTRYAVLDTAADPTFDALTRLAAQIAGAPVALISLTDDERQWFKARIGVDLHEMPRAWAPCAHVVYERRSIVCEDTLLDDRFADNPLVTGPPYVRFYAGMALETPRGAILGTLAIMDMQPRTLNEFQLSALKLLAQQVVDQLELRLAYDDLSALRVREQELENRLRAEKMEEAQQLAGELHDGVGQELSGISMMLAACLRTPDASAALMRAAVEEALPLLTDAIDSCRRVAEGYGGFLIRNEGIMGALERYVGRLRHADIHVEFAGTASPVPLPCLNELEAYQLFGIAREAIANACRHSRGKRVTVRCEHKDESVAIFVDDDGVGLADSGRTGSGIGRSIMEHRARSIGATLTFAARAGGGLSVTCRLRCKQHGSSATAAA